jgi:hypothetical protein
MTRTIGHLVRITGLVIELVGIWALYAGRDDKAPTLVWLPGGRAVPAAWLAVGLGFILWLSGRILLSISREGRRARKSEPESDDAQRLE